MDRPTWFRVELGEWTSPDTAEKVGQAIAMLTDVVSVKIEQSAPPTKATPDPQADIGTCPCPHCVAERAKKCRPDPTIWHDSEATTKTVVPMVDYFCKNDCSSFNLQDCLPADMNGYRDKPELPLCPKYEKAAAHDPEVSFVERRFGHLVINSEQASALWTQEEIDQGHAAAIKLREDLLSGAKQVTVTHPIGDISKLPESVTTTTGGEWVSLSAEVAQVVDETEHAILHYPHASDAVLQIQNALQKMSHRLSALLPAQPKYPDGPIVLVDMSKDDKTRFAARMLPMGLTAYGATRTEAVDKLVRMTEADIRVHMSVRFGFDSQPAHPIGITAEKMADWLCANVIGMYRKQAELLAEQLLKDLPALQGRASISKELWAKLPYFAPGEKQLLQAWLKELGFEVEQEKETA